MKKATGIFQKISMASGVLSLAAAIACSGYLLLRFSTFGASSPITASLIASVFFFICVGVVLIVIGRSNLPSFKIE